jgi:hypothetical protein
LLKRHIISFEAYISDMGHPFSHLLGTTGMLLIMLLWLSLINPPKADHLVDSLAGPQQEYKIALGAPAHQSEKTTGN